MNTVTHKSAHYGWKSETAVVVDDTHEIRIVTMKRSNGFLVTNATRMKVENDMVSYMMFSDFSKNYKLTDVRCTEKNVIAQHNAVLADIEIIKADCAAFYAKGK